MTACSTTTKTINFQDFIDLKCGSMLTTLKLFGKTSYTEGTTYCFFNHFCIFLPNYYYCFKGQMWANVVAPLLAKSFEYFPYKMVIILFLQPYYKLKINSISVTSEIICFTLIYHLPREIIVHDIKINIQIPEIWWMSSEGETTLNFSW